MKRYTPFIVVCLCISVALNVYLLWPRLQSANEHPGQQLPHGQPPEPQQTTRVTTSVPANTGNTLAQVTPPADPTVSGQPAKATLSQARLWIDNGDYARVERYLIDALREAPHSAELLLLEADLLLATKPLSTAVLHFYTLLDLPVFTPQQHQELATRTETLVSNAIDALYNARDWDLLARFIEPLYQLNSRDERITLKLAEAYARQQKFTLMEDTLASLDANNAGARSLRQRYFDSQNSLTGSAPEHKQAPATQTAQTRIGLTRYGDQYIVDTNILNRPAALLIDTGASSTAISFELYRTLKRVSNVNVVGLFDVRTAGGIIRSPLVRIKTMQLGPYILSDIGVLVLPRNTMLNADGLLGMNVLKQFKFTLEQSTSELLLTPR